MYKLKKGTCAVILCILCFATCLPVSAAGTTRKIKAGYFAFSGYHMMDKCGDRSGYGYEYLQYMASYNNWNYEYIGYDKSWSDMLEMLGNGEIDLLTSAQKTPEREAQFAFSDKPIGHSAAIFTVRAGDTRYAAGDYENYSGIRVGMIEGSTRNDRFQEFAEEHEFTYTPVYFENNGDLARALQENRGIDAIVTSNLRKIEHEWVLDEFASSPFYVIVRKDDTKLLQEVNNAISQVQRYHPTLEDNLLQKYYTPSSGDEIAYTASERQYISEFSEKGIPLRVLLNPDRAPLSWFEDGQAQGVFAKLGAKVLDRAGLPYEIIETKNRQEYRQIRDSSDYDIALDTSVDFNEAEKLGYKLTQPYISVSLFQLTRKDFSRLPTSIAALKGADITHGFIEKSFAPESITYYDTVNDCVQAVLDKKQDAAYFYTYSAQSIIYNDTTGHLMTSEIPGYATSFAISVKNTHDIRLLSILNKSLASFNENDLNQMVTAGTVYPQKDQTLSAFLYTHPLILVILLAFVFFMILLMIMLLYKSRGRKTEKARLNDYERFISYVCRMNELVLEIDLNTMNSWYYNTINGNVVKSKLSSDQLKELSGSLWFEDAEQLSPRLQRDYLNTLVDQTSEYYFECRITRDTPEPHWYAFTIQGLARDSMHPNSIMILGHDIDMAKKEEDQRRKTLQDALAAAQQASETKSSFLSRMSHEMRTPLNAIIGYLELGKKNADDTEKLWDYMAKSDIAAHQLLSIINDVLDMASIESGKLHLEKVQFELTEEINEIREMFESQAWHKKLDFQVLMDSSEKIYIMGDPLRLNQILINLLSNAVKFTPAGGKVTLSVKKTALQEGHVYYCFEVTDTGIGMSEEYLDSLFDPFVQQDASIARKYGGSGLGMSITKNLVTMKQGTISVKSTPGEGTVFTVNLPFQLIQQVEDIPEKESWNTACDFAGMHVLLAEDNPMNREIATEILSAAGFSVTSAEDGEIAVQKFLSEPPDTFQIILMDIQMPVMNGYDAAQKIRSSKHPQAKTIPIYALTANAFAEDVNKALAAGMNGHIAKPLDVEKMLEVLSDCLRG